MKVSSGKKVVVHRGGTIKKGRLINVTRCRVAGSDVSVARAANLHQATEVRTLRSPFLSCSPESAFSGACLAADLDVKRTGKLNLEILNPVNHFFVLYHYAFL